MGHKWARFKRLFGADSSTGLLQVRNRKIADALQGADVQILRLEAAGLDARAFRTELQQITNRTAVANRDLPTDRLAPVLEELKLAARQLEDSTLAAANEQVAQLATALAKARTDVAEPIDAAEKLATPLCKLAIAATLSTVKDARDNAEQQATDEARRLALTQIDLSTINTIVETASKIDCRYTWIETRRKRASDTLDELPDVPEKAGWVNDYQAFLLRIAALSDETVLDTLFDKAHALYEYAQKTLTPPMVIKLSQLKAAAANLAAARERIASLVNKATGVSHEAGKAILADPLDTVTDLRDTAEQEATDVEKTAALNLIDLKPLQAAYVQVQDLDGGLSKLMVGIGVTIGKMGEGEQKRAMTQRLNELALALVDMDDEADLGEARKGFAVLKVTANDLMDDVLAVRGKAGYEDALQARFGVQVTKVDGALVDLQKTYEMMALVPESHVGHDKVSTVHFTKKPDHGASYGRGSINMDDFDEGYSYTYTPGGRNDKVNAFNVCMLHEIGHAVDDKYKLMDGVMEQAGYGDWKSESWASVLDVFVQAALAELGEGLSVELQGSVRTLINGALRGTAPTRPEGTSRSQWKTIQKHTTRALAVRESENPWFDPKVNAAAIDGRVYLESYKGKWHSYAVSERQADSVRDYQWRAPGEWFADLYGYLWLKNKAPSPSVGKAVTPWLPQA